ncbi:MAG: ATP-binding protein [Verrucomicrobiales bacterium]
MGPTNDGGRGALTTVFSKDGDERVVVAERKARLLHEVIESLPVAVFCKDVADDYRFILWNRKNEEILGIKEEDALGKTDYDLFSAETAEFFRKIDKVVMSNEQMLDIREEIVDSPTLGKIFLHTMKVPVKDPESGLNLLLGIAQDITERKKAQEQVQRLGEDLSVKERELLEANESLSSANEELKATQLQLIQAEKMESVGRLAAGVAHEVKNPLALLLMGVEYLSSGGIDFSDDNVPEVLREMSQAIERADAIIRGLVDFSSSHRLDLKPTEVNSFVENALLLVRHELTRESICVEKHLAPDLPLALIDAAKMEQVLVNIFINAAHAMESSEKRSLEVLTYESVLGDEAVAHDEGARSAFHLRPGDPVVVMEILDTGAGIPEEKIDKIFDPFFTTKATGRGTGLGLTVVKKIIDLHSGMIEIQNRATAGVCVTITLRAHDDSGDLEPES